MSAVDLLPCPFCGGEPTLYLGRGAYGVKCTCSGKSFIHTYAGGFVNPPRSQEDAKDSAIAAWNRRAPVSAGKVKALDPEQLVADWMAESEGFATRGERFMGTIMDGNDVAPWLHAACKVGIEAALGIQRGDGWQGIESLDDLREAIADEERTLQAQIAQMHAGTRDSGPREYERLAWAAFCRITANIPPDPPASLPQGEETR